MAIFDYSTSLLSSSAKLTAIALTSVCSLSIAPEVSAQNMNAPSRTLFKCQERGKIVYSDSPCFGAEKLEVEPTRGVNRLSGKEQIGPDVQRELHRERFAEAVRPLTGLNAKQFEVQARRFHLPGPAQQECRQLDQDLANTEREEKGAAQAALRGVQMRLFLMRQRFRELRC